MGFLLEPINVSVPIAGALRAVRVVYDGNGPSVLTIRDLVKELCIDSNQVIVSLILFRENRDVLPQLTPQTEAFFKKRAEEIADKLKETSLADFVLREALGPEDGSFPIHEFASKMLVAVDLGLPVPDLEIDFSQLGGMVLGIGPDKAAWDQCRATKSKMSMRNRAEVVAYRKAATALLPGLKQLEATLKAADAAGEAHRKGAGKNGLNAFALLSATHEMTAVYSQQDAGAERLAAKTQSLVEIVAAEVKKDAEKALRPHVDALEKIYESEDFCNNLYDYFEAWDPSHVYYFDAAVKRGQESKDLNAFDTRLFRAIDRATQLLSMKATHVAKVVDELLAAAMAVWKEVVDTPGALKSDEERRKTAREILKKVFKEEKPGWFAVAAVWSSRITTTVGNMEGPPSVMSLALSWYSARDNFLKLLLSKKEDLSRLEGVIRFVVLIGVDPLERDTVLKLIQDKKKTHVELGRKIFNNASWRSRAVFPVYYLFSLVIMLRNANNLADQFASGKQSGDFNAEVIKAILPVFQDGLGFMLTGFTQFYSNQMGAYLRTNGTQRLNELANEVARLETATFPARATPFVHAALAGISVGLAYWSFVDETPTAPKIEDFLLFATAASALVSLGGVFLKALGPWGFVAGVLVTLTQFGYDTWFKPTMTKAMQGIGKTLLADPYLKAKGKLDAGKRTVFVVFTEDVNLTGLLEDTVEELTEYDWEDKLDPAHLVDYARSGLPPKKIAQLYKIEEEEVVKRLRIARAEARERKLAAVKTEIELVQPSRFSVELLVGELSDIKFAVSHRDREQLPNNIWLEPVFGAEDPDELLADNGQLPATTYSSEDRVVMLLTRSSTQFGRVYAGSMRVNKRPISGKLAFTVFVADDRFAQRPRSDLGALVLKDVEFTVKSA